MNLLCVNKQRVKPIGCFLTRAPSLMFDGIPNMALFEEVSITCVTQGDLKLPLPPDSLG